MSNARKDANAAIAAAKSPETDGGLRAAPRHRRLRRQRLQRHGDACPPAEDQSTRALRKTIDGGEALDASVADVVANAMKDWAIEQGATHFTHWFLPMTGPDRREARLVHRADARWAARSWNFPAASLMKGEPDASSFPSGGIRKHTFEARGYTALGRHLPRLPGGRRERQGRCASPPRSSPTPAKPST